MADDKNKAEKSKASGSKHASSPESSVGSKFGGLFSRKPKPLPKQAPKKGQSSFLKNFNVKEVGEASSSKPKPISAATEKKDDFRPVKKEGEDWRSIVASGESKKDDQKSDTSPRTVPVSIARPKESQPPQQIEHPVKAPVRSEPKPVPKLSPPPIREDMKAAAKPVQIKPAGIPKPLQSQRPESAPASKVEQPAAKALPQTKSAPKPLAVKSARLLPGQKQGSEVGVASTTSALTLGNRPKSSSQPQGLPSLPSKTAVGDIPPAKPPVPLARPVKVENVTAPPRKAGKTGKLKKESIRLRQNKQAAGKPSKPADAPAPDKVEDPSFSQPPIPLDANKKSGVKPVTGDKGSAAKTAATLSDKPMDKAVKPSAKPKHKKAPKVVLPPPRESSGSNKLLLLIPMIILLIAGIAFLVYWMQRETSVEVIVNAGELTPRQEAHVVLNFAGKLEMLRNDYFRRRTPVEEEIGQIKANLQAAQGDLAGREQRKKLLQDALEQYQAEIPEFLSQSQKQLDQLWNEESAALSKEYDDFKESLHQQIEQRAQELGVDYVRNSEIDAIAVAVNAYRLALYGVAKDVNVGEERSWAEDLLQQWNAFEESWRERQAEIKQKALEIKKDPIPKISETRQRIDNLEREIDALDIDLNSLKSEIARYESHLVEVTSRLQAIDDPFFDELRSIPDQFKVATYPLNPEGTIILPDLQEHPDLKSGSHFILVTAVKGDQEFWAIQEFEVLPYQTVNVVVEPSRFTDLKTILEKGIFIKP